ncbi:Wzz/FepE/Etk N-terminal domain-containing protein [Telmatospirillum sp. J64-1]|uniref:Wzz/FepE/Etk N-terminal domain-containing protein n=1 Tax=Telmatospirillum sp. J64-1 TaxID=2502183 RepID=UPI00115C5CCD|nr:Wzz/FepE/Etk N-terminal domain-containing protein [Telmatospirillum sp. J64-1]
MAFKKDSAQEDGQVNAGTRQREPALSSPSAREETIEVAAILAALWRGKWLILLSLILCLAAALLYLRFATPEYRARMVVGPVSPSLAGPMPPAFTLPALLGRDSGGDKDLARFLSMIDAVSSARRLARNHGLLPMVFAEDWDEEKQRFQPPSGPLARLRDLLGLPGWTPPDAHDLAAYLGRKVTVEKLPESGLRALTFSHPQRDFAIRLLTLLHQEIDAQLREEAIARSEERILYLRERLDSVTRNDQRQSLIALLSELEKARMMLHAGGFHAAEITDPATAPSRPSTPKPALVLLIGTLAGLVLGAAAALGLGLGLDRLRA